MTYNYNYIAIVTFHNGGTFLWKVASALDMTKATLKFAKYLREHEDWNLERDSLELIEDDNIESLDLDGVKENMWIKQGEE